MVIYDGKTLNEIALATELPCCIELDGSQSYILQTPLVINKPVEIDGHGARISGTTDTAIIVHSGGVTIKNLVLDSFPNSVVVDAKGKTISDILVSHVNVNDPGYGMVFNVGSTESDSHIENLRFENCVLRSAYSEKEFLEKNMFDGATAFMLTAASPTADRQEDICRCSIDGLYIEKCEIYGGRRYGINMLAGIILPVEGYSFYSQKARVVDCTIRNVKILDCVVDYCREMAITLSCGTIMNYGSLLENLEVARCKVVYGIAGIGYSAAGPVVPTSIARNIGVRHGSIHDNYLTEMALPVNEPSVALGLTGGRAEGIGGIECYDSFVEDIQIYNNTIENANIGIGINAANTLTDEKCTLAGNRVCDIDIYGNTLINCQKAFFFTAAYGEARRFDYDWGWYHRDQNWAPLLTDHHVETVEFTGNRVENIACHDNSITGCRYEVEATGASTRGHAVVKDNKLLNVSYYGNTFQRSEGHVIVMPVYAHDWVTDAGGNETSEQFLY